MPVVGAMTRRYVRPSPAVVVDSASCWFMLLLFTCGLSSTRVVAASFVVVGRSPSSKKVLYYQQKFGVAKGSLRMSSSSSSTTPATTASDNNNDDAAAAKELLLSCPSIPMRNGRNHPAIGFGTYKVGFVPASASSAATTTTAATSSSTQQQQQRSARECVLDALKMGYRCLECAEFYGNEAQVGLAIQDSGIPREELFLCSKVWTTTMEQGPDAIRARFQQTLHDLQTDYLDLYLIHWPVPYHHVIAYRTIQELQNEFPNQLRGIGVSNYAWEDYLELKEAGLSTPLVNQIEINPFLYRQRTIDLFQREGVVLQSYRSLRDGKAMDHPVLLEMAKKYGNNNNKTPAQILGRWCVQHGFVYLPKSVRPERMMENAQVFDFSLTPEDVQTLDQLTTPEALETFLQLYRKCVNRDTSRDGSMEGVKLNITVD